LRDCELFSHGLQQFRTKIKPLILNGFLGAWFWHKNILSFTTWYCEMLVTDEDKRRRLGHPV